MLDHKVDLGKFKKVEILSGTFSNPNAMRLEINYKEKKKKLKKTHTWRLNTMLLNNQWITEESKRK